MREHIGEQGIQPWDGADSPSKQMAEMISRRLPEIVVCGRRCRIGGTLSPDNLADTSEIGDWNLPDFRTACSYASITGLAIVQDDTLTHTATALAAASAPDQQSSADVSEPWPDPGPDRLLSRRHQRENVAVVGRRVHWRRLVYPALSGIGKSGWPDDGLAVRVIHVHDHILDRAT